MVNHRALMLWPALATLALALHCVSPQPGRCADAAKPLTAAQTEAAAKATSAQAVAAAETAAAAAKADERKREIETARARCTAVLKPVTVVAVPKDPIEDGECGAPAPVELASTGKKPQVDFLPAAIVNCDMAVALHDWIKSDVQPLAIKYLGTPVVRVETMSSYSCRHAYGRVHNKLSEHGKANALDIRGFATAGGETAYVLEDWGPTSVEIAAATATAQKEADQREAAAAKAKAEQDARTAAAAKAPGGGPPAGKTVGDPLAISNALPADLPKAMKPGTGLGLAQPDRLGGPAKMQGGARPEIGAAVSSPDEKVAAAKSLFLRAVHDSACRRFGTTLGPEANAAHRNHMHVDLAERKVKTICE